MTFRGLQEESKAQGQAHSSIAKELTTLVADPFDGWARGYKVRSDAASMGLCLTPRTGEIKAKQSHSC